MSIGPTLVSMDIATARLNHLIASLIYDSISGVKI
jgi:hypothetical protein